MIDRSTLPGVVQLVDSLSAGGAERVAVNLANLLPRERYRSFLCTTRSEGPLAELVAADVVRLCLERKRRIDLGGLHKLVVFIRQHKINIIHAHSTSLFLAMQASLFPPYPKVIWHDHFGRYAIEERAAWLYRLFTTRVSGLIIVNRALTDWIQHKLHVPADRIWYVPNFVLESASDSAIPELPGQSGKRIVCVANLRPEKGHLTLIAAMAEIARHDTSVHLLLVGAPSNLEYRKKVEAEIKRLALDNQITLVGHQIDVLAILRGCDIGVLSSYSEAFPLSLIEYGKVGLAAVATDVGECPTILDHGHAGLIVPPGDSRKLAEALLQLLSAYDQRKMLGAILQERVSHLYTPESVMKQIGTIYEKLLQ